MRIKIIYIYIYIFVIRFIRYKLKPDSRTMGVELYIHD